MQAGVSHALDDQVCSILVVDDVPKPRKKRLLGLIYGALRFL